jgi:hypothetical protein
MSLGTDQPPCAFPPHPGATAAGEVVTEPAWSRLRGWLAHAPAERVPLPAVPAVWSVAEIMHLAAVPGLYPSAATVAAAGLAFGLGEARARKPERIRVPGSKQEKLRKRLRGAELAAATAAVGTWVTAADIAGPLAGRWHLLSIIYVLGAVIGYWWLRRHEAIRAARDAREAEARWVERKAGWHRLASHLPGLRDSHLLHEEETLLGETRLIDTIGTGNLASQLPYAAIAERLAEIDQVPMGRIDVAPDAQLAGKLWITTRRIDPWAKPIWHPAASGTCDPQAPFAGLMDPAQATIRKPLMLGADPETGDPLELPLWDANGAKVVLIAASPGAGKSMLLDTLTERITVCPDARLLQINLSKGLEDSWWAPLAEANALHGDVGRALAVLQFAVDAIAERPNSGRTARVHQPTAAEPLFVLKIDEIDAVSSDPERKQLLRLIASKCRSEGWAMVLAGQRPTAAWVGGADVRANIKYIVWGAFGRDSETRMAGGSDAIELPSMGRYGGGNPGVFGVAPQPLGGSYAKGRAFFWGDDSPGLRQLVAARAAAREPYVLEPALARLADAWAAITGDGPIDLDDGRYDLAQARTGQTVPGTAGIRARLDQVRERAAEPVHLPPKPPGWDEMIAERNLQVRATWKPLPEALQARLWSLLARPGGITTRTAAAELSAGEEGISHTRVHQQLMLWREAGPPAAEKRGSGPDQRWHAVPAAVPGMAPGTPAATPGTPHPPSGTPYLWAVPDPGEAGPAAAEGSTP